MENTKELSINPTTVILSGECWQIDTEFLRRILLHLSLDWNSLVVLRPTGLRTTVLGWLARGSEVVMYIRETQHIGQVHS